MSRITKDILFFIFKVLITCTICVTLIRLYIWYNNKPFDTLANILFYLSLSFLLIGFLSILIIFLKSTFGNGNSQQVRDSFTYKDFLSFTTLIILDGIIFIVISFLLTFIISFQTGT